MSAEFRFWKCNKQPLVVTAKILAGLCHFYIENKTRLFQKKEEAFCLLFLAFHEKLMRSCLTTTGSKKTHLPNITAGNTTLLQFSNILKIYLKRDWESAKGSNRHKWCTSWFHGEYLDSCCKETDVAPHRSKD